MYTPETVHVSTYIVISQGRRDFSVRSATKKPSVGPGEVCIKLNVELPGALFITPAIEAKVQVPKESVTPVAISSAAVENVKKIVGKNTKLPVRIKLINFPDGSGE